MAVYRFSGRDSSNKLITGEALGGSSGAIVEQLQNRGVVPLSIVQVDQEDDTEAWGAMIMEPWPTVDELVLYTRQMQTLIRSGIPVVRALRGVRDGIHSKRFRKALTDIISGVEGGMELSTTMQAHPKIFSNMYCNMIHIGEQSGRLDESYGQLHRYMEVDRDTRRRIKSALRYPIFVIVAMFSAIFCIAFFVIPAFFAFYAQFDLQLPWQTKLLLNTSKFVLAYWWAIFIVIFGALAGFTTYIRTPVGDLWWSEFKFKLPVVGSIIKRGTLSRFARAFSMGTSSGVPVLQSLAAVAQAVDNSFVAIKVREMIDGIQSGETLLQAAFATKLFPPLVMQMLAVGDETGQVDRMMADVAQFYEQELEYDVKALTALIEPIITIMLGGMVFILAVGVFLPMWDLVQLAGKH